tara:strand:- start:1595 stop:1834 length:240 start_codon:yes stop_codon:yes gene_type:complete
MAFDGLIVQILAGLMRRAADVLFCCAYGGKCQLSGEGRLPLTTDMGRLAVLQQSTPFWSSSNNVAASRTCRRSTTAFPL